MKALTCVDDGLLLESSGCSLHEEGHETQLDVVLFLEIVLELVSQFHCGTHVDLLEGGQQRVGVLRVFKTLADALAHATQWLTAFTAALLAPFFLLVSLE